MSHGRLNYNAVIQAVVSPDPQMPCEELYHQNHTKVCKVEASPPVVVRIVSRSQEDDALRANILEAVANDVTARILHHETRDINNVPVAIQIQTYLPGEPLDHYPHPNEAQAIGKATHTLHSRLCSISSRFSDKGIPDLKDITMGLVAAADESPMRESACRLLENPRFQELIHEEPRYLTYGDPWPDNFLIDESHGDIQVHIADIDPILYAPKVLQPAMLFSAHFIISFLRYASKDDRLLDVDKLIAIWPEPLDWSDVLLMMQVYPILLGLQKTLSFSGTSAPERAVLDANLTLLRRCLDVVMQLG